MRNTRRLLPRLSKTVQGKLSGLWRVYKTSHLLQIASLLAAIPLVLALFGIAYVSFDRRDLPDLDSFIRFEPPTMGYIFDSNGYVLIEMGKNTGKSFSMQKSLRFCDTRSFRPKTKTSSRTREWTIRFILVCFAKQTSTL